MDSDKTILYYTANTEPEGFAQKIREDLVKKAGNIPIISISRKPVDLGKNICIGEKPVSYTTEWRQLLIGLKAAKTKYVIATEADCLYPPEYFSFTPPEEKMMYNYKNIWIVWTRHNGFYKKYGYCEGAQICDREYWISRLEQLLNDSWVPYTREEENALVQKIFPTRKEFTGRAVISFKTGSGVSSRTTYNRHTKTQNIPYWGDLLSIKSKYL